nr:DEAD/DEAH box helicase [Vibrio crassostreae]
MADDMGTGKTIQSLAIVQHKGYSNTLILCPNIASPTWEKEILKFYPLISEKDILRIKTVDQDFTTEDLKAAKFTIVHYDIVYKLHARLTECKIFDAIIADESHKIKNKDSQRSKAAFVFAEVHEPKGRFLLSGSITTGRPKDLIAQLEFLDLLESEFGGFLEFTARYCNGHRNEYGYWEYSGASNLPELYEKLASCCMVRRKKTDVLKDLPTKMRSCVAVELSNAAEYKALESEAVNNLAAEFQEAAEVAAKKRKAKLKDEALEQFDEAAYAKSVIQAKLESYHAGGALSQVGLLKSIAARGKIKPAVEWIKNYLDNDVRAPLVVFPNSRQAQKEIYKKVSQLKEVNVLQITANHSPDERAAIIEDFQAGQCDVLIASLKATNTNVTLTAASTCLFPDLTDEADNFVQAEDRILRIGSTGDSVECVYLKADETIDDDVWERHISKVSNMALVQDGKISKEFDMRALASPYTRKLIQRVSKVLEVEY